jgi:TetR/AcrR family transcriptional repressor of nem operon
VVAGVSSRERIVRTGARLFLSTSFHAVGVDEVCRTADVRKGSFYHHFSSKSDLAKAVVDFNVAALDRRWATAPAADGLSTLRWMANQLAVVQVEFEARLGRVVGCPFGNLAVELATADEPVRRHIASAFGYIEHRLVAAVTHAVEDGSVRADIDADVVGHQVLAQFQGLTLLAKVCATPADGIGPALLAFLDEQVAPGRAA